MCAAKYPGEPSILEFCPFLRGNHVVTTSLGFAAMSRVQGRLHLDPSSRSVKKRPLTGAICEVPGVGPKKQREIFANGLGLKEACQLRC